MTSPADATRPAAVVVLAAGEGTRMRSRTAKVLHELCGRSLVGHVLAAARGVRPEHLVVVVGHQREQVTAHVAELEPDAVTAVQDVQLGTGHAVRCALEALPELAGTVVVLNADTPLVTPDTLATLLAAHGGHAATVLCATVPDPAGLGRIVRHPDGRFARVVEERDAGVAERAIAEVNSGIYAFDAGLLAKTLDRLGTDNDQGQEYLPDVLGLLSGDGHPVAAVTAADHRDVLGCNDRVQLAELRAILRDRLVADWMRAGATVVDPATVWLDVDVVLGRDTVIHPNVQL
ncbi:MAG TPA: NTP transferase domain-containing protein, partial [Cryptosporangiaceae bacterium]|nr:NTP transferase domain-containing protein [Cryptosporangiaceae bacterium]